MMLEGNGVQRLGGSLAFVQETVLKTSHTCRYNALLSIHIFIQVVPGEPGAEVSEGKEL